jgi:hypothetical protein
MWPPMMTTFDINNAINTARTLNAAAIVSYNQSSDDYTIISYDESTNDSTIIKAALDNDAVNDTEIDVMDVGTSTQCYGAIPFPDSFFTVQ